MLRKYLNAELTYYPATKSAETNKMLTEKLINDEVTLQYGQEQGWVSGTADLSPENTANYLLRTNEIKKIKDRIEAEGDGISGSLVAIWFRNNGYVGPQGLAKGKQIAFSKISPLYQKVKNKEMTVEEAGKTIAEDSSLKEIDPSFDSNAIAPFRVKPAEQITFWPELDQMLRNTKPGELTTLYLGQGPDEKGQLTDELYIFGQVDQVEGNKGYTSYNQWLEKRKQSLAITQLSFNAVLDSLALLFKYDTVLADDNVNDNNFHGTPAWEGEVTTSTGAPVPGAILTFSNPCAGVTAQNPFIPDYVAYAGGDGRYSHEAMPYINCGCNPNSVKAYVKNSGIADASLVSTAYADGEVLCSTTTTEVRIPNQVAKVVHDVTCNPPNLPSPPPYPPPPACNTSCSNSSECALNPEGCTTCLPNSNGSGNTCQPPPPVCGASCTQASDCALNPNGCTACIPNGTGTGSVCATPPACGTGCTRDDQCAGTVKDGCTVCLPNSTGTGSVCSKPPACGVSCERDDQCAGAVKDGCSVCAPGANGVKVCQEPFDDGACKCDGFNALNLQNPANSNFQFEAFAKVEGANVNKAAVKSIQFQMIKSTKANPNGGTVIATSDLLTPQIVSNDSSKVRYRSTWSVTPPAYDPNGVYRVFANIKCDRKFASKSASLNESILGDTYNSDNNQLVQKELNYSPVKLAQANQNLELGTLKDGYFTKITETDSCRFIRFEYGQY
jgi:hypothetical protein